MQKILPQCRICNAFLSIFSWNANVTWFTNLSICSLKTFFWNLSDNKMMKPFSISAEGQSGDELAAWRRAVPVLLVITHPLQDPRANQVIECLLTLLTSYYSCFYLEGDWYPGKACVVNISWSYLPDSQPIPHQTYCTDFMQKTSHNLAGIFFGYTWGSISKHFTLPSTFLWDLGVVHCTD